MVMTGLRTTILLDRRCCCAGCSPFPIDLYRARCLPMLGWGDSYEDAFASSFAVVRRPSYGWSAEHRPSIGKVPDETTRRC